MTTTFGLTRYRARIGLSDADLPAAHDSLRAIQTAQLRSIPFEDIDPFLGRTPDLSPAAIFDKTAHAGRIGDGSPQQAPNGSYRSGDRGKGAGAPLGRRLDRAQWL